MTSTHSETTSNTPKDTPGPANKSPLHQSGNRYLQLAAPNFRATRQGAVRLLTLVLLRWMTVFGQALALLIIGGFMGYDLPMMTSLLIVASAGAVNIYLSVRYRTARWLNAKGAISNLSFDTVQLTTLLYFTGGLMNPFCLLFLVPVTVAATILSLRSTAVIYGLALVCISILALWNEPLPWIQGTTFNLHHTYVLGIWVALAFGMAFIAGYIRLVVQETHSMGRALHATQMALERERRVSDLGALAAAAAHQMGTPLNTIRVLIAEVQAELDTNPTAKADLTHMIQEVQRCKSILDHMARSHKKTGPLILSRLEPATLLEDLAAPHRDHGKRIIVHNVGGPHTTRAITLERTPEVIHALNILIENAVDFAATTVTLTARWTDHHLTFDIEDDGPGIEDDLLKSLGQPYVSGRDATQTAIDAAAYDAPVRHTGLGMGIFIARTLLERLDATLSFSNRAPHGAHVKVTWHLEDLYGAEIT